MHALAVLVLIAALPAVLVCGWAGWLAERSRTGVVTNDDVSRETSSALLFGPPEQGWCQQCPPGTWHTHREEDCA